MASFKAASFATTFESLKISSKLFKAATLSAFFCCISLPELVNALCHSVIWTKLSSLILDL